MIESSFDIWVYHNQPGNIVCITTNGFVKTNGQAVMGRGCALEAKQRFPDLPLRFGIYLKRQGNTAGYVFPSGHAYDDKLLVFPVKHNWWETADLGLIAKSRTFLCGEAIHNPDIIYHLPRPGCGNGKLDWETVEPYLEILPNNVVVHHKEL